MKNDLRTITLTIGIQGSGKTVWSMEQLRLYPGKYKRVNKDSLRAILNVRDSIVERSLMRGYDVIVDDTNFSDKHWQAMRAIAKRIGNIRVFEKYFEVDIEEAIRRNASRPNPVPEGVIRSLYEKNVKGKHITVRDEYFPRVVPQLPMDKDPSKQPAVVADIDGTIALNVSRDYYDMTRILEDVPNEPICELVRMFKEKGYWIIIVSGRDDSCKADTETWLKCNNIPYDMIHMRKVGDSRKDVIVKQEIYQTSIKQFFNVAYVLDDRIQTVRGWRDLGLTVLQLNDIDF
jgi:predicted kinase